MILYGVHFNGKLEKAYMKAGAARSAIIKKAKWRTGDWELVEYGPNGVSEKFSKEVIEEKIKVNNLKSKIRFAKRRIKTFECYLKMALERKTYNIHAEKQREADIVVYEEHIKNSQAEWEKVKLELDSLKK